MKWIELIVVRAAGNERESFIRNLIKPVMNKDRPSGLGEIVLYRNAFVETDVCIHLQWEVEGEEPAKSDLGIGLAAAFEDLGRIHHTIWIKDEM